MERRAWDADREVGADEARTLIADRFPQLAVVGVTPLGVGWDNVAFVAEIAGGERLVFRFPRRDIAASLILREARVLPQLAPFLPLLIPAPTLAAGPGDDFLYPFAGYPYLTGVTADRAEWDDEARAWCAAPLGRFLAALHTIAVDDATREWAPGDEIGRTDLSKRFMMAKERLERIADRLPEGLAGRVLDEMSALSETKGWVGPGVWVHGDFYARHFLVDERRRPCAVIDWGDVHLGDPALDVSIGYGFLPERARDEFRSAYEASGGVADESLWKRARFRARFYGVILTDYAMAVGDLALERAGRMALGVR